MLEQSAAEAMREYLDALRDQPPTAARTAQFLIPAWLADRFDRAEIDAQATAMAQAYGFRDAEIVVAPRDFDRVDYPASWWDEQLASDDRLVP